ncbi:hypothetical protein Vafri_11716 [Volvox africanus]|uniref:Uncharacterized protein n=1 Tax=Volvox africanus TaxID=51714 RepID=A0A8J4F1N8_9CHLO|nr:hypothetical protein Vafri_11716 [Volvox africanus]
MTPPPVAWAAPPMVSHSEVLLRHHATAPAAAAALAPPSSPPPPPPPPSPAAMSRFVVPVVRSPALSVTIWVVQQEGSAPDPLSAVEVTDARPVPSPGPNVRPFCA